MKTIYLLRHAKAKKAEAGLDDFNRPLAARGRHASALVADWFEARGAGPDRVLCSPALRTRQTLEFVAPALRGATIEYEDRLYEAEPGDLLALLRALPRGVGSVLLVGHNPSTELVARGLAGSGAPRALTRLHAKYPTAGLAVLSAPIESWRELVGNGARLSEFIIPDDLEGPSAPVPRERTES